MKGHYNYLLLFLFLFIGVLLFAIANQNNEEGFSLPGVILPGVTLPGVTLPGVVLPSARPYMRRARLFKEHSVRQIEKMTTKMNAGAMMASNS